MTERAVVEHLREHGPSTYDELLSESNVRDRMNGIARLSVVKKAACGKNGNGYGNLREEVTMDSCD
ncbi:MAG: hypothetical protein U5J64_08145 [Halobacteriales archaeon]|nr:hypothetical protein [Halobacteriales archaeon]